MIKTKRGVRALNANARRFRVFSRRLSAHLLEVYGVQVVEKEVVDATEYIGSFDGRVISVREDLKPEHKFFLIVHLFGHCVQWCGPRSMDYSSIKDLLPINNGGGVSSAQLTELFDYELEAAGYGLSLLSTAFEEDFSQWFANWARADWEYFTKIVDLEKRRSVRLKVRTGADLIPGRAIPEIRLRKIPVQYAY